MAVISEAVRGVLRLQARLASGPSTPPSTWRKGVLLGANHIGDILYRTASLDQLSATFPGCEWHMIAPQPASEVLEGNPAIRKIHRFDLPVSAGAPFETLRREAYDVAICYDTGMYLRPLALTVKLGIPNRVGYIHKGFSGWVTRPVPIRFPQPFSAYFRDLVADLSGLEPDWELRPRIIMRSEDILGAAEFQDRLSPANERGRIAIFATTRQPTNIWPEESTAELVRTLARSGFSPILCGAKNDRPTLARIQAGASLPCDILAGELSLRSLTAFLQGCQAVVTPDSGPRHLANAVGTPVFFFRNLRSNPVETGIYCKGERDIINEFGDRTGVTIQNPSTVPAEFVAGLLCAGS